MIEINQILLNATKADKNGRIFTKEVWDSIIESEQNKSHVIPVVSHFDIDSDFTSIPMQNIIGMADCSWFGEDLNVHLVLTDDKLKDVGFMPSFRVDEEDIKTIDGIDIISKCSLNCFFATDCPAIETNG